jgi:hypothetical protein
MGAYDSYNKYCSVLKNNEATVCKTIRKDCQNISGENKVQNNFSICRKIHIYLINAARDTGHIWRRNWMTGF